VRTIVDATNALKPDVVLLTGDYVFESPRYVPQVAKALSQLRPKIGCVGVLGNHDWWEDADLARRELKRARIALIDNDRLVLTTSRRFEGNASEGLCIAGVGDFWEDRQLYGQALGRLPHDMHRILLSHNPDVAEAEELAQSRLRVDLIVCGHTHGGQIQLPFVPNPAAGVSRYGAKYTHGMVQGPIAPVYTSAGLGTVGVPIRLGTTPEIAVFELRSA
jgi:predicted MPP superfamily phosphohydrolase